MNTPTGRSSEAAPQLQNLPMNLGQEMRQQMTKLRRAMRPDASIADAFYFAPQRAQGKSWLVFRWALAAHEHRMAVQREAAREGTTAICRAVHEFLNSFRR